MSVSASLWKSVNLCVFLCACVTLIRIIIWHRGGWWAVLHSRESEEKDTSQNIVVERGEVFQRVYHRADKVVIPLDLRENLNKHNTAITYLISYTVAGTLT